MIIIDDFLFTVEWIHWKIQIEKLNWDKLHKNDWRQSRFSLIQPVLKFVKLAQFDKSSDACQCMKLVITGGPSASTENSLASDL